MTQRLGKKKADQFSTWPICSGYFQDSFKPHLIHLENELISKCRRLFFPIRRALQSQTYVWNVPTSLTVQKKQNTQTQMNSHNRIFQGLKEVKENSILASQKRTLARERKSTRQKNGDATRTLQPFVEES